MKYAAIFILIMIFVSAFLLNELPDNRLHIYFLDVGQGDCILIKSPENKTILIDAGPGSSAVKLIGKTLGHLNRKIDLMILSHPHKDHFEGMLEVVKRYEIGKILLPNASSADPLYSTLLNEIKSRKIETAFVPQNSDIDFGAGVFMDFLYSDSTISDKKSANESSVIFRLLYGKTSIIFTGDAPIEEEYSALKLNKDFSADLIKIGHHGSKYSTSEEFLYEINSIYAAIQSGAKNRFGHPHKEALDRLEKRNVQIFRNDFSGTLEFISDGETISISI
ncbi:MAG: beta-lactamase [Candidatus Peregrinibacteria bacterium GW2011_GWF2_38_29]|nr:MAG: beta-lactamase [Candidatus Peregrinibacteria bacterium GW2011_GWF2_38_29]HBB03065.1 MBL fold metallo-hydrolase [Candidatus Peregrinibacteria bacterium]